MITAQEAIKLVQEETELQADNFFERHSVFLSRLDSQIKEKCKKLEVGLRIDIHSGELFTKEDFEFLMNYLSKELKYKTRTDIGNYHSFEIFWDTNGLNR
jgi:hypothetical protein